MKVTFDQIHSFRADDNVFCQLSRNVQAELKEFQYELKQIQTRLKAIVNANHKNKRNGGK